MSSESRPNTAKTKKAWPKLNTVSRKPISKKTPVMLWPSTRQTISTKPWNRVRWGVCKSLKQQSRDLGMQVWDHNRAHGSDPTMPPPDFYVLVTRNHITFEHCECHLSWWKIKVWILRRLTKHPKLSNCYWKERKVARMRSYAPQMDRSTFFLRFPVIFSQHRHFTLKSDSLTQ